MECIRKYEEQIRAPLEHAKQELDIKILKIANQEIRENCALQFRQEAMGGTTDQAEGKNVIQDLELKLRAQISEKYRFMKQEFVMFCSGKAKQYLDDQTQAIRRNIQQAGYESLDQVLDDIQQIKDNYFGPKYPGYEILIAETMSQLVAKASDYLGMSKNQETQISLKRLNERVAELEN